MLWSSSKLQEPISKGLDEGNTMEMYGKPVGKNGITGNFFLLMQVMTDGDTY